MFNSNFSLANLKNSHFLFLDSQRVNFLLLYKGKIEKIEEELKEANIQKNKYNIEIKKLPNEDKERHIVIISVL